MDKQQQILKHIEVMEPVIFALSKKYKNNINQEIKDLQQEGRMAIIEALADRLDLLEVEPNKSFLRKCLTNHYNQLANKEKTQLPDIYNLDIVYEKYDDWLRHEVELTVEEEIVLDLMEAGFSIRDIATITGFYRQKITKMLVDIAARAPK